MLTRTAWWLAIGLALWQMAPSAGATDLLEVWRAAVVNDKTHAVDSAAHAAAQPRRAQATSLWKPRVGLTASVGVATNDTDTQGAQFSAPGVGPSAGVGFSTSVTSGTAGRWAIAATMPLYNPERRAQQQQLHLSVDAAELAWQAATQALMLRTAERYFDLALAEETVRVLGLQLGAVQQAATEAEDRFKLGAAPVTGTHEARARLAALRAQWLAAQTDLQRKRGMLADSTGLAPDQLSTRLPAVAAPGASNGASIGASNGASDRPLAHWLDQAQRNNPGIGGRLLAVDLARREAEKFSRQASASVDLVAQAGRDRLSGSGDFGAASNAGSNRMVGIQLSVPLFTGGHRSARELEARRRVDQAVAEVEAAREHVQQQVRAAWLGLRVGAERVQALGEALTATGARADATRTGRDVGQRTTLDLLNAENDVATARLSLAQGRVDLLLDRLRLSALAGQLDEGTLRAANADLAPAEVQVVPGLPTR